MRKLLFIGNSHLAAVKLAWEQAQPKGYAAEFFGAPQRAWARMGLLPGNHFGLTDGGDFKRQAQITAQANGRISVSLDDRDAVILVGGFSAAEGMAALLADCDVPDLRETGAPTLLSGPLFAHALAGLAQAALPPKGWHNRGDFALAALPRPAPADSCLASTWSGYAHWHRLARSPSGLADAFALNDAVLGKTFSKAGLSYVPQSPATRTEIGLTQAGFLAAGGGIRPGEDHKRGDHAHMNADYGAHCVAQIVTWLESQS